MKIVIRNIGFLFLAVVIVFATGGYNLIKHQCGTTGHITTSVFIEEHCEMDVEKSGEQEKQKSCCGLAGEKNPSSLGCEDHHNCCHTSFTFFKTDQFDNTKSSNKSFEFVILYASSIKIKTLKDFSCLEDIIKYNLKIPPSDYGKQLLFSIHQLKIPSPLV
jgi:hypothetical protein